MRSCDTAAWHAQIDVRVTCMQAIALLDTLNKDVNTFVMRVCHSASERSDLYAQAIALLDTLDKDVNTFVMRVREWYSWHFPELVRIVPDNYTYARLALAVQDKTDLSDDKKAELAEITGVCTPVFSTLQPLEASGHTQWGFRIS